MLGSTNLGPLVLLVFYCNFVKHGLFATKFCTQCHRQREQMLQIWLAYDYYFLLSHVRIYCDKSKRTNVIKIEK